jgi:hypothetical protein
MTTAWAHLPNAAHIDRILADLKAHPDIWNDAYHTHHAYNAVRGDALWAAERDAAYDAARGAVRAAAVAAAGDAYDAAGNTADDAPWLDAWIVAKGAILCLIAYDNSAHYLNCSPDHLETLAGLGIDEAILLRPAVIALNT